MAVGQSRQILEEKHCQYRKCDMDSRKIVQSNENKKSAYEDIRSIL